MRNLILEKDLYYQNLLANDVAVFLAVPCLKAGRAFRGSATYALHCFATLRNSPIGKPLQSLTEKKSIIFLLLKNKLLFFLFS